ncbi:hypothetical protein F383_27869 [Gossypium arboreum]|uniref:Uncharacterized protein n=1 Tax=Gossypium arboreum TaxID=29729 RepID=A0A0B0P7A4_GOSAR|nr:hypothetical protein F383_27869 [Gossypium arboreum]
MPMSQTWSYLNTHEALLDISDNLQNNSQIK